MEFFSHEEVGGVVIGEYDSTMLDSMRDWLGYFLRWGHLIAGISWIGSSFYFIWLDKALTLPEKPKEDVEGEVWMVHSGGFYQVERKKIGPGSMPRTLHWFKWEAAFTWITGFLLMAVVYYSGGGALLFDDSTATSNVSQAIWVSLLLLPLSWFIYDGLWNSRLGKKPQLASIICFVLMILLIHFLCSYFGGRAAYMHVGAVFGTLMVANVWVRILPAQQQMIDATQRGEKPDYTLSSKAKLRSVHNSYLTLPVLFLMLSNHYPMTYGSEKSEIILLLLFVLGASVRHYKITKEKVGFLPPILIVLSLLGLLYLTTQKPTPENVESTNSQQPAGQAVDLSQAGEISVEVSFTGMAPPPKKILATPECASVLKKPLRSEPVQSQNGKLQNVFVWISKGLENKTFPIPKEEVVVDQRECSYRPSVIGVQVGQALTFLNSDPFLHNIHSLAKENEKFNLTLANRNNRVTRKFMRPEVMLKSKCDLHPWMTGFIGVVSHPYFGVSDERGKSPLLKIPPGTYTLSAWHETLGTKTQEVNLGPHEKKSVEFSFP